MIETYLTDTVVLVTEVKDKWGSITSETELEYRARVDWSQHLVTDFSGKQITANGTVLFKIGVIIVSGQMIEVEGQRRQVVAKRINKDFGERSIEVSIV